MGSEGSLAVIGTLLAWDDARSDLRMTTGVLPGNWMRDQHDADPFIC
jgi:hypothetical protein